MSTSLIEKKYAGLMALAFVVGCGAQEQKNAEKAAAEAAQKAAAELKQAKDALSHEVKQDLEAAKKEASDLRAGLSTLDEKTAKVYHEALDELDREHDAAAARMAKAGEASDDTWHKLGQEAREDAAKVRKAARRVAALAGDVKEDFEREADAVLEESRNEIDALKAKSAGLDEKARKENDKLAAALEKDWEAAKKSLGKAKSATGDAWKGVRHDVNHDLHKVKSALRAAATELKKG
jgi:colicin import membrane protein